MSSDQSRKIMEIPAVASGAKPERLSFAKVRGNGVETMDQDVFQPGQGPSALAEHVGSVHDFQPQHKPVLHAHSKARTKIIQIAASGLKSAAKAPINLNTAPVDAPPAQTPVSSFPANSETYISKSGDGLSNGRGGGSVQLPISPTPEVEIRPHAPASVPCDNLGAAAEGYGLGVSVVIDKDKVRESERRPLVSFTDAVNPPSLDGKSVASGTTFALDEKESLRPDDSASVKAVDDEELFSAPSTRPPTSLVDSQDNKRAFRQQLHDIEALEPVGRVGPTPGFDFEPSSMQGVLYIPPQGPGIGNVPRPLRHEDLVIGSLNVQPDPKLLEALDSPRDRIWVLKLEQDIYDFVKDPKETSLNLPQCNAYHRMLAHRIADYYMLGHVVDDSTSAVRLYKTPNCRIPPPLTGITTPSTAASTPPPSAPQMKILRRGDGTGTANESTMTSKTGSENGESSNDDDKKKAPASREEREARYEAARLRIMGSARPIDMPDTVKEKDDSRSSSAVGKKTKKKQRSDSEDGFEARSAYSAFYHSGYAQNAFMAGPHNMQTYPDATPSQASMTAIPPPPMANVNYPPYAPQASGMGQWQNAAMATHDPHVWSGMPSPGYDLSQEFNRSMSFQGPTMTRQSSSHSNSIPAFQLGQTPQNMHLHNHQQQQQPQPQPQQMGAYPMQWPYQPQQSYQTPHVTQQSSYSVANVQSYSPRPSSSSNRGFDAHSYQYGQLPSEAFPGRPSSKLEHPLPGSYKGKHFNPHSQAFVPGQPSGRPTTPKGVQSPIGHGTPVTQSPLQRHTSGPSQPASFHPHSNLMNASVSQPMVHPLPQPVFPRQPSPSMPLPPKPGAALPPLRPVEPPISTPFNTQNMVSHSTIAKWGTPASLPAKPPRSNEPFDALRYAPIGRQPSSNIAVPARNSNMGGYTVVNGSGVSAVKPA